MKHFLKLTLTVFLAIGWGNTYAQKEGRPFIDSLLRVLPKLTDDTNKVKLLDTLSFLYLHMNPDEGIKYAQQGLDLATKLEWEKGIASSNNNIGNNYVVKTDYEKALGYLLKAATIYEETGDKQSIVKLYGKIGSIYGIQSDYPKALEYFLKQIKLNEEMGDKKGIATTTGSIANVYYHQKDYPKALEYDFKALKSDEETGDKRGIASVSGNIGNVYYERNDYPKALEYFLKSLKNFEEIGEKHGIALFTGNIGQVYTKQKNYALALAYEQKALNINEETGDKNNVAWQFDFMGNTYLSLVTDTTAKRTTGYPRFGGSSELPESKYLPSPPIPPSKAARLRNAVDYLQRGLAIGKEIKSPAIMMFSYEHLAEAFKQNGDYKQALECDDNLILIRDSVYSKENDEKIVKMTMKYEYDRQRLADSLKTDAKEKITHIQLQRQQSYTYMGIAGVLLLAGFSFFIMKERKKSEQERKKSDTLLLNILPAEVANELKLNGSTKARHFDNVTVLFTDFVNFTSAGERISPQGLIDELHACFKAFDEITSKYNIEKIKTIGDAYLAVCGLPLADPKHAENIVRAAIEIDAFMQDRIAKLGNSTFEIRIGIHTGDVVAGIVGVKKFAYDIWGDTVNTAARMEQNSAPGKINISQTTYELVKDTFRCEYRGEIEAKNKGELKMYFVNT